MTNASEINLFSPNPEPLSENSTTSESNKCDKIDNNKSTTSTATLENNAADTSSKTDKSNQNNNKKRVTFRNTLETSDDFHVVKKVYNPNFNGPIVSIIKKESLQRPILVYKKNCIVRPSRLTEIVKNSSANNIDKLNSLKFGRDYHANHNNLFLSGGDDNSSSNIIAGSKFTTSSINSKIIKPGKRFNFNGDDAGIDAGKRLIKQSSWCSELQDEDSQTSRENKRFGKFTFYNL